MLPALYDIRNNRNVGHVGGDVDPNHMDSTYVLNATRWILSELVRLFHSVSVTEAQAVVESLTDKIVPVIWKVPSGAKRVLIPGMTMKNRMLLMLYDAHPEPILEPDLFRYVEHSNASVFRRDVIRPAHKAALINYQAPGGVIHISPTGLRLVEETLPLSI
jgi:hypothetical protein